MKYFLLILISSFSAFAQIDQFQGYLGTSLFPANEKIGISGVPENYFAKYRPAINIGGGVSFFLNDNFRFSANIEYSNSSKTGYKLNLLNILPSLNYHFGSFDNKVSPYIGVSGNISFVSIKQEAYSRVIQRDSAYYIQSSGNISSNPVLIREEYFNILFVPVFGGGLSAGVDLKLTEKFGVFVQGNYNVLLTNSAKLIKENLDNNKSNMINTSIIIGIRYRRI